MPVDRHDEQNGFQQAGLGGRVDDYLLEKDQSNNPLDPVLGYERKNSGDENANYVHH